LLPALVPARADFRPPNLEDGKQSYGLALFVGYQFGPTPERSGVEWGLEAFMTHRFRVEECGDDPRAGIGPSLQFAMLDARDPRLSLLVHGGGEFVRSISLTGELGLSYRFSEVDPGLSVQIGVVPEFVLFDAGVRYQLLRNEVWVGGGLRYLPRYGEPGFCAEGRPVRHGSYVCDGPLPVSTGSSAAQLSAAGFARAAQLECAAVSAFLQLALELRQLGAPAALVARALDAARDELRHTQLCERLAGRGLRLSVRSQLPPVHVRSHLTRRELRVRLAEESWLDGCLAEGSAARQAAAAADCTLDSATHKVLQTVAREEARHAALAWDVLDHCLSREPQAVRAALRGCAERRLAPVSGQHHPSGLQRHGQLSAATIARVRETQRALDHARLRERGVLG
jgi:hypothetical protein